MTEGLKKVFPWPERVCSGCNKVMQAEAENKSFEELVFDAVICEHCARD